MAESNAAQRADWNGESGIRWVADADRRDVILAPVLDALLAAATIEGSADVLDIGCGCGTATIAAARLLTTGTATGVDISSTMLGLARERAAESHRVRFIEADAQATPLAGSFDVVISRFGTMFFDDPVAAFRNIAASTSSTGRMCIATWQPLEANEWLVVPGAVLLKYASALPPTEPGPGMFSQSDPAEIEATLSAAGWHNARVAPVEVRLRLGSDPADAVDYLAGTGVARRVLDTIDPAAQSDALADVAETLTGYTTDGVYLHGGINIVTADRSTDR